MTFAAERQWDEGLTGVTRRIAETSSSPLRVVAGPGTGKTYSLMRCIARLLQEGTRPERILVVTFTRTSAADLSRSLSELELVGVNDVQAGTLHSFCYRLLRREEVFKITGRFPRPLLSFEERFLLADLKHEGLGGIRHCEKNLKAFAAAWARLQSEVPGWPSLPEDQRFYDSLMRWLRFYCAMLLGEFVTEAFRYLRNNQMSDAMLDFDHILVDEYQDLNRAEQCLIDILASQGSLCVVGDEDQSIYSFRCAHPEGISEFSETHKNT